VNHCTGPSFRFRKSGVKGALIAAGCLAAMLWALGGQAQPLVGPLLGSKGSHQKDKDQPAPVQKGNRFLFIVDTSSSMRADSIYVRESVTDLLKSAMQGQLRDGDTIGLWTYDDQLHTEFPMQVWSTENSPVVCERVAAYLTDREYRKRAHLDKVLPYVRRVIETSRLITIVFVYDGSQPMRGTPFDKDINDLQKQFLHEVRADNLPFVTILAARDGAVFEYTVNVPNSVVVPHTAEPLKEPATNAPPAVAVQTNNPAPVAPVAPPHFEIVMTGPHAHRTDTAPADASTAPASVAPASASASPYSSPASTPVTLTVVSTTPPANSPSSLAGGNSTVGTSTTPASSATPVQPAALSPSTPQVTSAAPAPSPLTPPASTASGPVTLTVVPAVALPPAAQVVTTTDGWNVIVQNAAAPAAPAVQIVPASTVVAPAAPNLPAPTPAAGFSSPPPQPGPVSTAPSRPPNPTPAVAAAFQPVAPQSAGAAQPEPPATSTPAPAANGPSAANAEPGLEANAATTVYQPTGRPAAVPVAVFPLPVPSTGDHIALLVIALSLVTIAAVLVVFLMRRARGGPPPSFISRSMDHPP
jgi:Meckel syndrome type 1 protein